MKVAPWFLACAWSAATSLNATAAEDLGAALLGRAGADSLGYLRIEQPTAVIGKLDTLGRKFGGRASDFLPLVAQRYLKNPMLRGVDMDRPCTIVFLNPQKFTNNLAIAIGVTDADEFRNSFGRGGVSRVQPDATTTNAPVRHFTETVEEFNQKGYIAALRAGEQPDPASFRKQVTRHFYVTVRNGQGLIAGDKTLIEKLEPSRKPPGSGLVRGDVVAGFRGPAALALYEDDIRKQQKAILMLAERAAARGGSQPGGQAGARRGRVLAATIDGVLGFAKQLDWLEAAADLRDGWLNARFGLRPVPGTALARALAAQSPKPADRALLSMMPADVAMLSAWNVTYTPEFVDVYAQYLLPILQTSAPTNAASSAQSFSSVLRETMAQQTGSVAVALKPLPAEQKGFDLVQVYRIKDAKQARKLQRKAAEAGIQAISGFLSESARKMQYKPNVAKHAGVEIDEMQMDLGALGDPEVQRAVSQNMLGTNLTSQLAFVGSLGLAATGPHAAGDIRRLIDLAKAAPATPPSRPRLDAAVASFPAKHNGFFFVKLEDYFGILTAALPGAPSADIERMRGLLAAAQADIAGFFTLQPSAAVTEMRIPLEKLIEVSRKTPPAPQPQ